MRIHDYIDYKMGAVGALVMGGTVGAINASYGAVSALTAGAKQAAYTFVAAGILMKACEAIATKVKRKILALLLATTIPALVTTSAVCGLHQLKGTSRPLESTMPTATIAIPGCFWWAYRKRRQMEEATSSDSKISPTRARIQ